MDHQGPGCLMDVAPCSWLTTCLSRVLVNTDKEGLGRGVHVSCQVGAEEGSWRGGQVGCPSSSLLSGINEDRLT